MEKEKEEEKEEEERGREGGEGVVTRVPVGMVAVVSTLT